MTEIIEEASGISEQFELRNYSDLDVGTIEADPHMRKLSRELSLWSDNLRSATQRGNMFDRGAYTPPNKSA